MNDFVYPNINNGVYKAGFCPSQTVYEKRLKIYFSALHKLEVILSSQNYLIGKSFLGNGIFAFSQLLSVWKSVYYGHFKCNIRHLTDYPNLWNYTKRIYNILRSAETVNFDHIQETLLWPTIKLSILQVSSQWDPNWIGISKFHILLDE